ncbi:MAG: DASS family sodium-coupled anion symporter [Candidatus Krumholzibacteriota bacterium]|nr:DASS family sodium-coupled anion symporter [Candidatus Krumholzibacteriota bacterium]
MYGKRQKTGFFAGPAAMILLLLFARPGGMSPEALKVASVVILMAIWWITEAVPLAATALLPVALFPALGIMKASEATSPYANHLIFLFLGGFFIAVTMEKWNLHKRIALYTIRVVGTSPARIILGFMVASAFLSMWISNTATTMMMVPIGLAVIAQAAENIQAEGIKGIDTSPTRFRFGTSLMLGIAYASSIGGVGTLIGTPPNVFLAGFVENTWGVQISFLQWMTLGVPLAIIMVILTWVYLTKIVFPLEMKEIPGGKPFIDAEIARLGRMSGAEGKILLVFLLVAASWIARGFVKTGFFHSISDSTIAVIGALLLFVIPADFRRGDFLLDWKTALKVPWGVIILFGGGLSLANGFKVSGLDRWIGGQLVILDSSNYILLISIIVLVTVFLTEITSNTATSAMLIPIVASIAVAMSIHPYGPIIAVGISASYAFMLPVATPPNAIVFGSRQVTVPQMARAGFFLNILSWIIITLFITFILPVLWKIDLSTLPAWGK